MRDLESARARRRVAPPSARSRSFSLALSFPLSHHGNEYVHDDGHDSVVNDVQEGDLAKVALDGHKVRVQVLSGLADKIHCGGDERIWGRCGAVGRQFQRWHIHAHSLKSCRTRARTEEEVREKDAVGSLNAVLVPAPAGCARKFVRNADEPA